MLEEKCAILHINPYIKILRIQGFSVKGGGSRAWYFNILLISDETDSIIATPKNSFETARYKSFKKDFSLN